MISMLTAWKRLASSVLLLIYLYNFCTVHLFGSSRVLQRLNLQSTDITDAVYNSRWYRCDMVMQKNMLMVQTRLQYYLFLICSFWSKFQPKSQSLDKKHRLTFGKDVGLLLSPS